MRKKEYTSFEIDGLTFNSLESFNELVNKNIIDIQNRLEQIYLNVEFTEFSFCSTSDGDNDTCKEIELIFERDYTEKELKEREKQLRIEEARRIKFEQEQELKEIKQKEVRKNQYLKLKEEFEGQFEESL